MGKKLFFPYIYVYIFPFIYIWKDFRNKNKVTTHYGKSEQKQHHRQIHKSIDKCHFRIIDMTDANNRYTIDTEM
jgi:hypothetical protein